MINNNFIATPARTKELLRKHKFFFKKSLGQNFLVDVNILEQIIEHAGIDQSSGVIEIGPGLGALTEQLARHSEKVVAYEIDQRLLPILSETLQDYNNVEVIHEDILKADISKAIEEHFSPDQAIHVVANLPYYITTPILMKLLEDKLPVTSFTIMIQKEVAERMASNPNNKSYGSLSIAVQYYTKPELVLNVPSTVFMPRPNVNSSVLKLTMRETPPVNVTDETFFFSVVRASFMHRRKTLRNNLISFFQGEFTNSEITSILNNAEVDGGRRGESLDMTEFARVANAFYKAKQK